MDRNTFRIVALGIGLMMSASSHAWRGGYYHDGGVARGGYYHGAGYGYYHGGVWVGHGAVVGVPVTALPGCQTLRVCNSLGQCSLQKTCN